MRNPAILFSCLSMVLHSLQRFASCKRQNHKAENALYTFKRAEGICSKKMKILMPNRARIIENVVKKTA